MTRGGSGCSLVVCHLRSQSGSLPPPRCIWALAMWGGTAPSLHPLGACAARHLVTGGIARVWGCARGSTPPGCPASLSPLGTPPPPSPSAVLSGKWRHVWLWRGSPSGWQPRESATHVPRGAADPSFPAGPPGCLLPAPPPKAEPGFLLCSFKAPLLANALKTYQQA